MRKHRSWCRRRVRGAGRASAVVRANLWSKTRETSEVEVDKQGWRVRYGVLAFTQVVAAMDGKTHGPRRNVNP
jgi:hypothetical protein